MKIVPFVMPPPNADPVLEIRLVPDGANVIVEGRRTDGNSVWHPIAKIGEYGLYRYPGLAIGGVVRTEKGRIAICGEVNAN